MSSPTIAPPAGAPMTASAGDSPTPAVGALTGSTRPGPRMPYLPGIDGLRAVAVISVLLYHAQFAWMSGGFLGVEVFFVISGYLITSLLLAEKTRDGRVGLGTFYLRRARRLLPALLVTLVGVVVLCLVFVPDQMAGMRGDVVAALGYVSNWYAIIAQKSYFETAGGESLVKHLWSLAIEEQFYLIWPLLFTGLLKVVGRRRVLFVILGLAAASAGWMALLYSRIDGADPNALNRVYMGTDTRAAGLLIGAALAVAWSPWRLKADNLPRSAPYVLDVVGFAALGLLAWALYGVSEFSPSLYQGGFAKVSLLTALVIAVAAHPAAHLGKVLGCRPMRWVGLRSYGIYLYHFPIFVLIKPNPVDPNPNEWAFFAVRIALTIAVAELSFRFVEMPVRRGVVGQLWRNLRTAEGSERRTLRMRWLTGSVVVACSLVLLAVATVRAQPPEGPDYVAIATGAASGEDVGAPPGEVAGNVVGAANAATLTPPAGEGSVAPTPSGAADSTAPTVPEGSTPPSVDESSTTTAAPAPPAPPPGPPTTNPHGPVRMIGDSVMLGAGPTLRSAVGGDVAVDAQVGRQVSVGIQILRQWTSSGQIPDVVVIHLGNNGTFTDAQFDEIMSLLKDVRRVMFVTDKVPRRWQDPNNAVIGNGVQRYPNAVLVDWFSASNNHPEYFWSDGMHLRPEGAQALANLVLSHL